MFLPPVHRHASAAIAAIALGSVLASTAAAQDREWIAFDNEPAGTPPSVRSLPEQSSVSKSVFDVQVHGLWVEHRTVPGTNQTMQVVALPGNGALATDALGLPELPGIGLRLACTRYRADGGFSAENFQILPINQVVLDNMNVFPAQAHDDEDRTGGNGDDRFYFDADFYQATSTPFPHEHVRLLSGLHLNRKIPSMSCVATCMQSIPAAKQLIVNTRFQYTVLFPGNAADVVSMPPRAGASFNMSYDNAPVWWELELARLNMNADGGDYLIVTAYKYINELMPLIEQKTERGLHVTIVTTESLGAGFDQADVKTAISNWYGTCTNVYEVYVLLVGDVDEMPMHVDPVNSLPSDHYYVCLEDELFPSCELGRYSVDSEEDLAQQIAKTMKYSESPMLVSGHYERSLLAAHEQNSKKYVECIEDIESNEYLGYDPSFTMYSGRENTSTVANVVADIDDTHFGLVMYRGHGWQFQWGDDWNVLNEELWDTDVAGLTNGVYTPIVVSVACGNNHIDEVDDCIGETWMEGASNGAVAHIGSIRSSKTTPNHEFAKAFHSYYWCGYRLCLSEMMQDAWLTARMRSTNQANAEKNIYMCQLLGDPELRPWQSSPLEIRLVDLPHFTPESMEYTLELDLDVYQAEPTDVILNVLIDGIGQGPIRFDEDGRADVSLDLEDDSTVVLRAYAELANAADARYEVSVDDDATCPADLDGSGDVGVDDLLLMIAGWGSANSDLNGDGTTNVDDLLLMLAAFGVCE